MLVARLVLDEHEAGLYAGGLILTKAVLFLPQFVVVVAFPSMAAAPSGAGSTSRALGAGGRGSGLATLGAIVFSDLAIALRRAATHYAEIEPLLWLFAVLGTVLAMIQLMVYEVVARQGTAVGVPHLGRPARAGGLGCVQRRLGA